MRRREIVERAEAHIRDLGQQPRHRIAALAFLQPLLGDRAPAEQRAVDKFARALFERGFLADAVERGGAELGAQFRGVDNIFHACGLDPFRHALTLHRSAALGGGLRFRHECVVRLDGRKFARFRRHREAERGRAATSRGPWPVKEENR